MQLNNPKSNTSNIIKQSEAAKKKARRRLIGSIFMLFTALIILLNVTTKVKPIPVSPKVIEISNNASAPVKIDSSSVITKVASSEAITASSQPVKTIASNTQISASEPQTGGFKAGVVSNNEQRNTSTTTKATTVTPKVISLTIGHKPTPEEILNGTASNASSSTVFFIQIAASQDKNSLLEIQHNLANNGIKSFIQNTKNTNIYRLRVGPFKTKDAADQKLEQIQNSLNQ